MTDTSHESVLMHHVSRGDRQSFEELVRIHANGLLTFLRRTHGDYHQSEELFQEVFLAVWRSSFEFPTV
jgi:DNA-directed RNA polymerase specialized sigma24 family protein